MIRVDNAGNTVWWVPGQHNSNTSCSAHGMTVEMNYVAMPDTSDDQIVTIDSRRELHCIDGVWHEVNFGQKPGAALTQSVFDCVKRKHVWPGNRYAKRCRPLSDGECIAHGIRNRPTG